LVDVGEKSADRLLRSGQFRRVVQDPVVPEPEFDDAPAEAEPVEGPEVVEEALEAEPPSEDTPEPDTAEIRAWARENTDLNVPARGKLPDAAREAYKNAH
jgi:hypothetical protein